jgi:hypothetical protein
MAFLTLHAFSDERRSAGPDALSGRQGRLTEASRLQAKN